MQNYLISIWTSQGKRHNNFKYCNSQSGCIDFSYINLNCIMQVIHKSHLKMNHYKKANTSNYHIPKKFWGYLVSHIGIFGLFLAFPK